MLMMRLPSKGAIMAGSVAEAFHKPRSLPACSSEGKASIESAQSTLEYAPLPRPKRMPSGHSQAVKVEGKMTKASEAALMQSVDMQTMGARLEKRSERMPKTTPLTTPPHRASTATPAVTATKLVTCCTRAK